MADRFVDCYHQIDKSTSGDEMTGRNSDGHSRPGGDERIMTADLGIRRGLVVGHAAWLMAFLLAMRAFRPRRPRRSRPTPAIGFTSRTCPTSTRPSLRTIKELERQSPQTYFVVVVKSAGPGDQAATDTPTGLYDAWRARRNRGKT